MSDIIIFDKNKVQQFRQSNDLVESVYKATLTEKRILATMISMIKPEHDDFKEYKIDIKRFAEVFDIKGKSILDLVKKSTKNLLGRTIQINDEDKFLQINWISSAEYEKGSSNVTIRFDPKLKPYLLNLRGGYTTTLLDQVAKFKSVYAIRFYELFKQYSPNIKSRKFEIEHLKKLLGCEDDYPNYANFKDRVVKRAIFEINNLSDLIITFSELKSGKKIVAIIFNIEEKAAPAKIEDANQIGVAQISKEAQPVKLITLPQTSLSSKIPTLEQCIAHAEREKFSIDVKKFHKYYYSDLTDLPKLGMMKLMQSWADKPSNQIVIKAVVKKSLTTESEVIKTIREKIKQQICWANHNVSTDYFLYFDEKGVEKTTSGFLVTVSDSKALKYADELEKINVRIEVK